MTDQRDGGGLDLRGLQGENSAEALSGTGGSSGGGTVSGAGDPEGGAPDGPSTPRMDSLAARTDSEIAAEAGALGPADGSLADAAGLGGGERPATMGEAIGSGAGRGEPGSGGPSDRGELGGGDPLNAPGG